MFPSNNSHTYQIQKETMDTCWTQLPNDIVKLILLHLDGATRRDIGMMPRKLITLPQLELHRDKLVNYRGSIWLTILKQGGEKVTQLTWMAERFFYQRTDRVIFMTVHGIDIWRDQRVHQNVFIGASAE